MPAIHDRGGWPDETPISRADHAYADWEMRTDALSNVLTSAGYFTVDEKRRAIESLDPERYVSCLYYEKWVASIEALLVQKEILGRDEIEAKLAELAAAREG